jgi:hypothetical protein
MLIWLAGVVQAELLLFSDTFDAPKGNDINTNLVSRQSGTQATAEWSDNVGNDWHTQISANNTMALVKNAGAGTISAKLGVDFAPVSDEVRISVDVKMPYANSGFAMVNFGMAAADELNANAGYSFRLDNRQGDYILAFFDNGVQRGYINVTAYAGGSNALVIRYKDGNSVSATLNGWQYVFTTVGTTNYTGTTELENRVMLSWFGDGDPSLTTAEFDNVSVVTVPPVSPLTLKMELSGSAMDFEWTSEVLKQYDLESCTSLTDAAWASYSDGITVYENILASETGTNTLGGVLTDGAARFFRVVEEAGPTSFISVSGGSFEDPVGVVGAWSPVDAVWNPTLANDYALNKGSTSYFSTGAVDGQWMALMKNIGTISQDLATTVNAGDTLEVTFSGGNCMSSAATLTGGGIFNAVFNVGTTAYTMAVDTTALDPDTWQTYTNTVTVSNSGNLSLEFTTVSGIPWLDNISEVTRTELQ